MPNFKVGDRVRCITPKNRFEGLEAIVIGSDAAWDSAHPYKLKWEGEPRGYCGPGDDGGIWGDRALIAVDDSRFFIPEDWS